MLEIEHDFTVLEIEYDLKVLEIEYDLKVLEIEYDLKVLDASVGSLSCKIKDERGVLVHEERRV